MSVVVRDQASLAEDHVPEFRRDRLTWLCYLLYGFWSLSWGLFAPIMPFLRDELRLSNSMASLHFSSLAFGLLIAGICGIRILSRVSRTKALWTGTGAVAVATVSLAFSIHPAISIAAGVIIGFAGSIAGQALIGGLVDRFPKQRATTVAELVMVNSIFAAMAPLLVAVVINYGMPWRLSLALPVVILAAICAGTRCGGGGRLAPAPVSALESTRLPAAYWLYFAIVFLTVAAEWSIAFWCPEYLERVLKFERADACTGLSVFLFAMLFGRMIGARLTTIAPTQILLVGATGLAIVGFLLFWSSTQLVFVYAGLILLGLGESNCYPLALAAAIGAAAGKTTEATARMSISTGSAICLAPLLLGIAADHVGIAHAYGIVAVLLVIAALTAACSCFASRYLNVGRQA